MRIIPRDRINGVALKKYRYIFFVQKTKNNTWLYRDYLSCFHLFFIN